MGSGRGCFPFFFQAEDGIRDLVRSRGLGDVYKRQRQPGGLLGDPHRGVVDDLVEVLTESVAHPACVGAVSYTHLTLPTSDLV